MKDRLWVGTVLKPQGIRGEIKVKYHTDSPEDIKSCKRVYIDEEEKKILSFRSDGEAVYLGLYGVADRNAAELLRGKKLYADREDAPKPSEGSYYIVDLLGSKVITEEGEELGTLVSITPAATDVYTLCTAEKDILFPALADLFLEISPEEKRIVINKARFEEVAVL